VSAHLTLSADTGKMLARMMIRDRSLQTYADVLIKAYGQGAKNWIYAMCNFIFRCRAFQLGADLDWQSSSSSAP
jgi:hypothetical protein